MTVIPVPSWDLPTWRAQVLPHLVRFEQETQRTDAQLLLRQIERAERQLWVVADGHDCLGVAVTEIYETARGPVCWVWTACGTEIEPGQILAAFDHIKVWAKSIGCKSLGINGRKGWLRVLPGFRVTAYVMETEL